MTNDTVHGDIEVITSLYRHRAFVRVSKIAAIVEIRPGGPTNLIFTAGGELEICGDAEYWRRLVAISNLEMTRIEAPPNGASPQA
jgi:hypothetical protein